MEYVGMFVLALIIGAFIGFGSMIFIKGNNLYKDWDEEDRGVSLGIGAVIAIIIFFIFCIGTCSGCDSIQKPH